MRKLAALALALALAFFLPFIAFAQFDPGSSGLDVTAGEAYGEDAISGANSNIAVFVGYYIIRPVLGLTGLLFLVLTIYAGFLWMTSQGDAARVKKAKDILVTSVTGAVLMASAYVITQAVITAVTTGTTT